MMQKLRARTTVIAIAGALVAGFLLYAFWPRALSVDIGEIMRGPMIVAIQDEARTRVRDAYVVSAPVTGKLLRVDVEPGDAVEAGQSIVARMLPANPTVLDVRTEEQARASVESAEAALLLAKAEVKKAAADADYAKGALDRARGLRERDFLSEAAFDQEERAWRASSAALETAHAAVSMREAALENARALLMSQSDAEAIALGTNPHVVEPTPLRAPVSGSILRVFQESEGVVAAGTPIVEIGDAANDLEIVAELLSTDAVKVSAGDRVIIDKWGGDEPLHGVVERVEPWGFTKFSALGVEEQRVNTIIRFSDPPAALRALGHGYRVEVQIVTWENETALRAPSNAVFRTQEDWAVFKVARGRARLTRVSLGRNNGVTAEILDGLGEGDKVVLYPGNQVVDGRRVKARDLD